MAHLNIEEIAAFAEGNIEKSEHERFTKHIADCEECFKAYSDTLKFVREERERAALWRRFQAAVTEAARKFGQVVGELFPQNRILKPAPVFALLFFLAVALPVLLMLFPGGGKTGAAITQHLQERYKDLGGGYAFAGAGGDVYAAFRAGVFVEDLSRFQGSAGENRLKQKISSLLRKDLEFLGAGGDLLKEVSGAVGDTEKEKFAGVVERIAEVLEKRSLGELFQLGRFIEKSLLDTFNDKRPTKEDMAAHLPTVEKHNLPIGVSRGLRQTGAAAGIREVREILENITGIFLAIE